MSYATPAAKQSPLIALVASTLAHTSGYQMSEGLCALLQNDYELLAALQRLSFAALSSPSSAIPLRASRSVHRCPCGNGDTCTYPDCPLGDPVCRDRGGEQ